MTLRKLEFLRNLSDWQLRRMGYDPAEITKLCLEIDELFQSYLNKRYQELLYGVGGA